VTKDSKLIVGYRWRRVICWFKGHRWFNMTAITRTPVLDMLRIKNKVEVCLRCGKARSRR